ncbi:MAG: hypothetical protein ACRD12_20990 [Acidimicrobiales bacterium]
MLMVVLVACRDNGGPVVPSATVPTAPETTTTTNPFDVPPVIDAAYASRIIDALDAITGDVVRLVVSSKTIPREAFDRIKAQYAHDQNVDRELANYSRELSEGLSVYKPNPGNKKTRVTSVITGSNTCIYVSVERDYSAVGVRGLTSRPEWVALWPLDRRRDPNGYNTTGWAYIYDGFPPQGSQPERNPCFA